MSRDVERLDVNWTPRWPPSWLPDPGHCSDVRELEAWVERVILYKWVRLSDGSHELRRFAAHKRKSGREGSEWSCDTTRAKCGFSVRVTAGSRILLQNVVHDAKCDSHLAANPRPRTYGHSEYGTFKDALIWHLFKPLGQAEGEISCWEKSDAIRGQKQMDNEGGPPPDAILLQNHLWKWVYPDNSTPKRVVTYLDRNAEKTETGWKVRCRDYEQTKCAWAIICEQHHALVPFFHHHSEACTSHLTPQHRPQQQRGEDRYHREQREQPADPPMILFSTANRPRSRRGDDLPASLRLLAQSLNQNHRGVRREHSPVLTDERDRSTATTRSRDQPPSLGGCRTEEYMAWRAARERQGASRDSKHSQAKRASEQPIEGSSASDERRGDRKRQHHKEDERSDELQQPHQSSRSASKRQRLSSARPTGASHEPPESSRSASRQSAPAHRQTQASNPGSSERFTAEGSTYAPSLVNVSSSAARAFKEEYVSPCPHSPPRGQAARWSASSDSVDVDAVRSKSTKTTSTPSDSVRAQSAPESNDALIIPPWRRNGTFSDFDAPSDSDLATVAHHETPLSIDGHNGSSSKARGTAACAAPGPQRDAQSGGVSSMPRLTVPELRRYRVLLDIRAVWLQLRARATQPLSSTSAEREAFLQAEDDFLHSIASLLDARPDAIKAAAGERRMLVSASDRSHNDTKYPLYACMLCETGLDIGATSPATHPRLCRMYAWMLDRESFELALAMLKELIIGAGLHLRIDLRAAVAQPSEGNDDEGDDDGPEYWPGLAVGPAPAPGEAQPERQVWCAELRSFREVSHPTQQGRKSVVRCYALKLLSAEEAEAKDELVDCGSI